MGKGKGWNGRVEGLFPAIGDSGSSSGEGEGKGGGMAREGAWFEASRHFFFHFQHSPF